MTNPFRRRIAEHETSTKPNAPIGTVKAPFPQQEAPPPTEQPNRAQFPAGPSPGSTGFATFLQLERQARQAENSTALGFVMVNETRRLLPYRQAVLLRPHGGGWRVGAISAVPTIDRNTPLVQWVEQVMKAAAHGPERLKLQTLTQESPSAALGRDWGQWVGGMASYIPVPGRDGLPIAALWLARDKPLSEPEALLAERLAEAYGHALSAVEGKRAKPRRALWPRLVGGAALIAAVVAAFVPVEQSALAPARVSAADATIVSSPLVGVIAEIAVSPNQAVAAGTVLVRFEATDIQARRDVAARTLEVARAEYRRASQQAFTDREGAAQLAVLEAQIGLREAELAYSEDLLDRVEIVSPRDGIAVFADTDDWVGRPVVTGERIMALADPAGVEVSADLPVADAIQLETGARMRLFLDVDPLNPIDATLSRSAYEASITDDGVLAYAVRGDFQGGSEALPRVGLTGTVVLYGDPVPLWFHLLRRPISTIRQTLGL